MKNPRKYFLIVSFLVFLCIIFVKSMLNITKIIQEIKNPPLEIRIQACPIKDINYFQKFRNGNYLYALYRYEALGLKCEKK